MVNYIEIDLKKISANLMEIKRILSNTVKLLAVVKANAYGHGLIKTAQVLLKNGADGLIVFSPNEGLNLRDNKISAPIFVIGYTPDEQIKLSILNDLIMTVTDIKQLKKIDLAAQNVSKKAFVDIKLETGMNRFGFSEKEVLDHYPKIAKFKHITIYAIHSHFADATNPKYTNLQIKRFKNTLSQLELKNQPMIHLAATDGAYLHPEARFDAVRIGIGLYGYCDAKELKKRLKSVLCLKSTIAQIKYINKGESVSYRRTYICDKNRKIAILPIGYSDGLPRALSNTGEVLIKGKRAKIIGRICMNAMIVDVSGINCQVGDPVVLIGESGSDKIDAEEIAKLVGTNPHEILTGLSESLPRLYI